MNVIVKLFSDPSKLIGVGTLALGLAQMVLGNKQASYERNAMKEELKKEITEEILKKHSL